MIEQYFSATPKYNFPRTDTDVTLPQRLVELSLNSLRGAQNQHVKLSQQALQHRSVEPLHASVTKLQPIPLKPKTEETVVAAVDTSSIKIGETSKGVLVAVRGASVLKRRNYEYLRFGPFILHITEENLGKVCDALWMNPAKHDRQRPGIVQMPMRISNVLEKWLQTMLLKAIKGGLILFDGSLTSGTADAPTWQMREMLNDARERDNVVLAFSKMTTLRFNGYVITDFLLSHKPPYLLEISDVKLKPPMVLLGDVYVAKLTCGNYAYRLDIDKEVFQERKVEAVERLLGNDRFFQSYPETLRLAHILCTFTANEVIAMQHLIAHRYGIKIVNRPDMHRLLFGPFGKGEGRNEAV